MIQGIAQSIVQNRDQMDNQGIKVEEENESIYYVITLYVSFLTQLIVPRYEIQNSISVWINEKQILCF